MRMNMPSDARPIWLADERGIALVMALGVLIVLTILGTAMYSYTSSNSRATRLNQGRSTAWTIAEAGINQGFSLLSSPGIDVRKGDALTCTGGSCTTCGSTSCFTATVPGGYALWQGTLVQKDANGNLLTCVSPTPCPYWLITSTGFVRNPDAGTPAWKTAIAKVPLKAKPVPPFDLRAWNEIMATHPKSADGICDETIRNAGSISSPLYVYGNLCLQQTVAVTQSSLNVRGSISMDNPNAIVGSSSQPLPNLSPGGSVHIGANCAYSQYQSGTFNSCTGLWSNDNIYANSPDKSPDLTINAPVIDWAGAYANSSPGPNFPCLTSSGAPMPIYNGVFGDNNAVLDNSLANTPFNLTPATSYSCQTDYGWLTWDATNNLLSIRGAVFIDGNAYMQPVPANSRVQYIGRGVLYVYGDFFMKSAVLCANGTLFNAGGNKWDCNPALWTPNSSLFAIITHGSGGQPNTNMTLTDGVQLVSSTMEGAVYGLADIETDTSSKFYGPMLGNKVTIGQSVNTNFPPITLADFALNNVGVPPMTTDIMSYLNG
jgi:hypothetical protein